MKTFYLLVLNLITLSGLSQPQMYEITNCKGERRTVLYSQQLSNVMWCLKGDVKFKESIILKFSRSGTVSLDSLDQKAARFRAALPKNYWSNGVGVIRVDNIPDEAGRIWFERVYVVKNKNGLLKPFASCKVIFEGTDPERERADPKIQDIIITMDQKELNQKVRLINSLAMPERTK